MKKILTKSLVLMAAIFLSVLFTAPAIITAGAPPGPDIGPFITGITVTGADTVVNGESITLGVTIEPPGYTTTPRSVTWSVATLSGGTATIDSIDETTGVLTGTGVGTVAVTATSLNDITGTKEITVTAAPAAPAATAETTPDITEETTPVIEVAAITEDTTLAPVTTSVTGGQLPKTSTPWYNVLIAGAALTLIGAVSWWIIRKIYV